MGKIKLNNIDDVIDYTITAVGFIPGLDTAADIADVGNLLRLGNYGLALLSAGLAFIPGVSAPVARKSIGFLKRFPTKFGEYLETFRNRKLRMTHTTTLEDIQKSLSKGDKSLIVPSWAVYKNNGENLFLYEKGNNPIIFIGNKKIKDDPSYIQLKGDLATPMLDLLFERFKIDPSKTSNSEISELYIKRYDNILKEKAHPFKETIKNLDYVKYNEGKSLKEVPYRETSFIIGPDTEDFKKITKDLLEKLKIIVYPIEWTNLDKKLLKINLQNLIEDLYKNHKEIRLKLGGKILLKK